MSSKPRIETPGLQADMCRYESKLGSIRCSISSIRRQLGSTWGVVGSIWSPFIRMLPPTTYHPSHATHHTPHKRHKQRLVTAHSPAANQTGPRHELQTFGFITGGRADSTVDVSAEPFVSAMDSAATIHQRSHEQCRKWNGVKSSVHFFLVSRKKCRYRYFSILGK